MLYPYRAIMMILLITALAVGMGMPSMRTSHAQSASDFKKADLEKLPRFYEMKIKYIKDIMHIQDVALSLISVSDYNIFYAYCVQRLDADKTQNKHLKNYADQQKTAVDRHHELIRNNETILINAVLKRLYKDSGLEATAFEDVKAAMKPEMTAYRTRAKEIMRRKLMHDMVWGPTQCKAALKSGAAEIPKTTKPTATNTTSQKDENTSSFIETSLFHYVSLLAYGDQKAKDTADHLLQKPTPPAIKEETKTPEKPDKADKADKAE